MEAEVKADIEKWESDNDCQFLVGGVRFVEFIDQQWKEYNQAKEDEKNQRVRLQCLQTMCDSPLVMISELCMLVTEAS